MDPFFDDRGVALSIQAGLLSQSSFCTNISALSRCAAHRGLCAFEVEVTLLPAVSRPVRLGVLPLLEEGTRCYIYLSDNYFLHFSCREPSLKRGRVCNLQCNDASLNSSYIVSDGLSASSSWCRALDEAHNQILTSLLKLKLIYDRQSVGQSVLVSGAHPGPVTNFCFSLKFPLHSCGFVIL
jgi:hypothetical protein